VAPWWIRTVGIRTLNPITSIPAYAFLSCLGNVVTRVWALFHVARWLCLTALACFPILTRSPAPNDLCVDVPLNTNYSNKSNANLNPNPDLLTLNTLQVLESIVVWIAHYKYYTSEYLCCVHIILTSTCSSVTFAQLYYFRVISVKDTPDLKIPALVRHGSVWCTSDRQDRPGLKPNPHHNPILTTHIPQP
jgi:hypothetical protein